MYITNNSSQNLFDTPFSQICPHCSDSTYLVLISPPSYNVLLRFQPSKVGMSYMCMSCQEPIFLKFETNYSRINRQTIDIYDSAESVERPNINFDFEYLPDLVNSDFKETLKCYSVGAYNAFAAMARRTIQSSANELGASGKSKVQHQIIDMKEMADIDDETFDIIMQIILDGHDGSHPHLPALSEDRAKILLELLKDVMYQIFVRKGKLKKASELRLNQIKQ